MNKTLAPSLLARNNYFRKSATKVVAPGFIGAYKVGGSAIFLVKRDT
jgi:hypothetical protein